MPFRNSLVGNLNANLASKQQKKDLLKDLLGKKKGGDEGGGSDDKSSGASADGGVSEPLGASKSPSRHHHRSSKKSSNSTHSSTAPNHHRHHHHSGGITPLHLGGPPSTASIWRSYRNMTSYTLTLLPHSCSIHLSPHTGITRANIEPYFVAFLEDMRRETKQKSEILKGTTENGGCKWEKQVIFKGLTWSNSKIKLEIKSNTTLGINPLICSLEFPVKESLILGSCGARSSRTFNFKSHHAEGSLVVGFNCDPPLLPGVYGEGEGGAGMEGSGVDGNNVGGSGFGGSSAASAAAAGGKRMSSDYVGGVSRFRNIDSYDGRQEGGRNNTGGVSTGVGTWVAEEKMRAKRRDPTQLSVGMGNSCLLFDAGGLGVNGGVSGTVGGKANEVDGKGEFGGAKGTQAYVKNCDTMQI